MKEFARCKMRARGVGVTSVGDLVSLREGKTRGAIKKRQCGVGEQALWVEGVMWGRGLIETVQVLAQTTNKRELVTPDQGSWWTSWFWFSQHCELVDQIVRASSWSICRAECHRFEPRGTPVTYMSITCTEVWGISLILSPNPPHRLLTDMEMDRIRNERIYE